MHPLLYVKVTLVDGETLRVLRHWIGIAVLPSRMPPIPRCRIAPNRAVIPRVRVTAVPVAHMRITVRLRVPTRARVPALGLRLAARVLGASEPAEALIAEVRVIPTESGRSVSLRRFIRLYRKTYLARDPLTVAGAGAVQRLPLIHSLGGCVLASQGLRRFTRRRREDQRERERARDASTPTTHRVAASIISELSRRTHRGRSARLARGTHDSRRDATSDIFQHSLEIPRRARAASRGANFFKSTRFAAHRSPRVASRKRARDAANRLRDARRD